MDTITPLLRIKGLKTHFYISDGVIKAVNGVSLTIKRGETIGLVGESGCGKTVLALSIMRLIPSPPGRIISGKILFNERNLLELDSEQIRHIRGNEISMIFQEPMTSLNPVYTVGEQISEVIRLHQKASYKEAKEKVIDILRLVGISDPDKRYNDYPHHLSGGMRQRAMIAMALSCQPQLLIADEPTTALDVTIQAQILDLIDSLKRRFKMSVIMVTHDLGVIAETAQRVAVMYAGHIVEEASVDELFHLPLHPYTTGLLNSLPSINVKKEGRKRLKTIPGNVPDLLDMPSGCPFVQRCTRAIKKCLREPPKLSEIKNGHSVSCWNFSG